MIAVVGLGFVGLTTALGFAHYGMKVYGIEADEKRRKSINSGNIPFVEPGLEEELKLQLNRNFVLTYNLEDALHECDIVFFCVGTPCKEDGQADLTVLKDAMIDVINKRNRDKKYLFVIKSTIPPSTTQKNILPFVKEQMKTEEVLIANNPEFLREGHCWDDFINADRIVIGTQNDEAKERLDKIYEPFNIPIYFVDYTTAEFVKYLSNSMLATMISYANEMAVFADSIGGIDIKDAFHILHMDKRWKNCDMKSYVYPGCGYGGYCLPKDTNALYTIAKKNGINMGILGEVIKTNNNMPDRVAESIIKNLEPDSRIGILGLSFKPESDDVRDSVAAKVISELMEDGYTKLFAYDPIAIDNFKEKYDLNITYMNSLEEMDKKVDAYVIVTAWEEFRKLKNQTKKMVLDYRYM